MLRVVFPAAVAVALVATPVADAADSDTEIVWPTYKLVDKPYDRTLTCDRLEEEITHVSDDLHLLKVAKFKVEEAVRTIREMQQVMSRDQTSFSNIKSDESGLSFIDARTAIKDSQDIAEQRRDHLEALRQTCAANTGR